MTMYARVYGGSLYDLCLEEQLTESVLGELKEIREIIRDNPDYLRLLAEPSIRKDERTKMIEEAFGESAQRYVVNFLKLLCDKNLLNEFSGCVDEFTRRFNLDQGIVEAKVVSAVKLDDKQKSALIAKLEKTSGKKVSLIEKIDPKVLAGLRVEMEGVQFDGTVEGRIQGVSKKLNETII